MSEQEPNTEDSNGEHACPWDGCERDDFKSAKGMKAHHYRAHGESIAGIKVECDHCGAPKRVPPSKVESNDHHFCDPECHGKWNSDNRVGEDAHNWQGGGKTVQCDTCGSDKEVAYSQLPFKDHHFCDQECKYEWMSEKFSGDGSPCYKGKDTVPCDWCGSEVTRYPSSFEGLERAFCDGGCYGKWREENVWGPDHPQWVHGGFTYGPGWNEEKKEKVRERDNRQCQNCGRSEEEHIEMFGRKHHVHHIQKARSFDSAKERNAAENLVTLCMSKQCHQKWEQMSPLRPQVGGVVGD